MLSLRSWIPKHACAIRPQFSRTQSIQVQANLKSQTSGDHLQINNGMHQLLHFWPLHQPSLVFTKNLHPKSYFFCTVHNFWTFYSKTPNWLEFQKKYLHKWPLFLWLLSLKDLLFFVLNACVWRDVAPSYTALSEAGKFCILETESYNLVNTFRCKFKWRWKQNSSSTCTGSTDPTVKWKNFIGGQGWLQHCTGGDISYHHPLNVYESVHLGSLNKCQLYLRLCKWRHFKCKAQCRAHWRARENFET